MIRKLIFQQVDCFTDYMTCFVEITCVEIIISFVQQKKLQGFLVIVTAFSPTQSQTPLHRDNYGECKDDNVWTYITCDQHFYPMNGHLV